MSLIYKNITGNTAVLLNEGHAYSSQVPTGMSICNIHATDSVVIDLYISTTYKSDNRKTVGEGGNWNALEFTTDTYYILKGVTIPLGVTLTLPKEQFEWSPTEYKLYIKLNNSDSAADIIVNGNTIKATSYQTTGATIKSDY